MCWRGTPVLANVDQVMKLISVAEAADRLGICERLTWSLIYGDGLPHLKLGRRTLVPDDDLEDWVRSRTHGGRRPEDAGVAEPSTTDPSRPPRSQRSIPNSEPEGQR